MLIELNRSGELWWVTRQAPAGLNTYLRYGVKQSPVSRLCTFGFVTRLDDGDCVPCTDDGAPLPYKAKYGHRVDAVAYMETREQAMEIVLHMARDHTGYLRQPHDGCNWCEYMLSFETAEFTWERVQC